MRITKADASHLPGINLLMAPFFQVTIGPEHLGNDSIALVLVVDDQVKGFIWAGLLAGGTEAYIQHYVVDKSLHGKHIGAFMAIEIAERLIDVGIKRAFAHIEDQNLYGINSLTRCLQVGGTLSQSTFKFIEFNPSQVSSIIRK